jgi:Na+/H+ antiporter NhaC
MLKSYLIQYGRRGNQTDTLMGVGVFLRIRQQLLWSRLCSRTNALMKPGQIGVLPTFDATWAQGEKAMMPRVIIMLLAFLPDLPRDARP